MEFSCQRCDGCIPTSICQFISDAVYDGRLYAEAKTARPLLVLDPNSDPEALAATGIRFVSVGHSGCAQKSSTEAVRLKKTYEALIGRRWMDEDLLERVIGTDDSRQALQYAGQLVAVDAAARRTGRHRGQVPGAGGCDRLNLDDDIIRGELAAANRITMPGGMTRPIGVKPEGSKVDHMAAQSAKIDAGHVYLPKSAAWLGEFLTELLSFPNGRHDDQVDCVPSSSAGCRTRI